MNLIDDCSKTEMIVDAKDRFAYKTFIQVYDQLIRKFIFSFGKLY